MDASAISSLVNFGSAGAVIIVVIVFLRYIKERDYEWRLFFTALNEANIKDLEQITEAQERVVVQLAALQDSLQAHDRHVDERIDKTAEFVEKIARQYSRRSTRASHE